MITKHKMYCKNVELIEGYQEAIASLDKYELHHRLETHFSDGTKRPLQSRITSIELKALGMYYNRPPTELVWMKQKEHHRLHQESSPNLWKKGHVTWNKGKSSWNKGLKTGPRSEEVRRKISEGNKGKIISEEQRRKNSEHCIGTHWYNNGIINRRCKECPEGFTLGRL